MKCPFCGELDSKVVESRPAEDGSRIRRRRECLRCKERFTTYETVETIPLIVVKKDGSRESVDRQKLLNSMIKACGKRPVGFEELERAVDSIESRLSNALEKEVQSIHIGELAMDELRRIDEVAYIRFASVYRQFSDIDTFMQELSDMMRRRTEVRKEK